ncbi:low affinity iron permease family protein [Geomonas oryzisoli]|uniref:Low affinity iron permease family protein n=1 Tax=Geomonas oryzisoli TaxID=2847992 RepID=A0ABX8JA56_9BACT|nr:low affinity iron permease family protein [Geomonas oryzisoli]QWV93961.1 low affinity iron permease family protein [Geomonas oryzisoli]
MKLHEVSRFSRFATWVSHTSGHPSSFIFALAIIVVWAVTGPIFKFSDTWQLVINTGTTIITFLMVFVIQNTQNRDSVAIQLKLDEIIRSLDGANNALLNMEELDEKDLEAIRQSYLKLAEDARNALRKGRKQRATNPPSV